MWKSRPLALLVLITCGSAASAQVNGLDLDDPKNKDLMRVHYANSADLPDGIAFVSKLNLASALNSADSSAAELMVATEMGLDESAAAEFLSLMLSELEEFQARFNDRGREIACKNGEPRAFGSDAFLLLESVDDARALLSEQNFVRFKRKLDKEMAGTFQQWLDRSKLNIVHAVFDYRKMAQAIGVSNIDMELSNLCRSLGRGTNK